MMSKKTFIILGVILILFLTLLCIKIYVDHNTYVLYYENSLGVHKVYITDKEIKVKGYEQIECITTPCESVKTNFVVNFSDNNMKLVRLYLLEMFDDKVKKLDVEESKLNAVQIEVIESVITNNESNLENLNEKRNMLFYVYSSGLNCQTPRLVVYSDKTYEYNYQWSKDVEKVKSLIGTYTYDATKVLKNIDKYKELDEAPYVLTDELGNYYYAYSNNKELKSLLDELDIDLFTCIVEVD